MLVSRDWVLCYHRDRKTTNYTWWHLSAVCSGEELFHHRTGDVSSGMGNSAFPCYLYGHEVMVITDHSAVKVILQTPSPSRKHARWWLKVFTSGVGKVQMVYRPGCENARANALSHNPVRAGDQAQVSQVTSMDISQLLKVAPQPNDQSQGEFS